MDIRHAVGVKVGVPAEKLADVLVFQESPRFSARERAALQFCERTIRDDLEVTEECLARVRGTFYRGRDRGADVHHRLPDVCQQVCEGLEAYAPGFLVLRAGQHVMGPGRDWLGHDRR